MGARGGGDGMQLGLAPCMPFLLACPGAASMMLEESRNSPGSGFDTFMAAYLLGTLGYAGATLAIFAARVETFDEKSGRTCQRTRYPEECGKTPLSPSSAPELESWEDSSIAPPDASK